jgi:prepilin-type N-terminal cleavage/methylation domain-containing protein
MNKTTRTAFTLIELLVVIAIIGILSGLIVISMNASINSANDTKRKAGIDTIRKALLIYSALNGNTYPTGIPEAAGCTVGGTCTNLNAKILELLPNIPRDPVTGNYYPYVSNGTSYTVSSVFSNSSLYSYSSLSGFVSTPTVNYSCLAILNAGSSTGSGIYTIDPDGSGGNAAFQAYCDMATDGGGWTYVARGINTTTAAYGAVQTNPATAISWHLSESAVRNLYNGNLNYQVYIWDNVNDGDRIRIFRPKHDYSLTMTLEEYWNGSAWVLSGGNKSMYYFEVYVNYNGCVLRSNINNAITANSNMHWGYSGGTTNYIRCAIEANGPTNGLIFVR